MTIAVTTGMAADGIVEVGACVCFSGTKGSRRIRSGRSFHQVDDDGRLNRESKAARSPATSNVVRPATGVKQSGIAQNTADHVSSRRRLGSSSGRNVPFFLVRQLQTVKCCMNCRIQ